MINWKPKNQQVLPIGLDIGSEYIKMIQLAVKDEQLRVVAAESVQVDPKVDSKTERKQFVISAIEQMLSAGGFYKRDVISFLPNDKLRITSLRSAETDNEQIERLLEKEVSTRFELESSRSCVNYLLAGEVHQGGETKNELIMFAADNESIKNHIDMLEKATLRPVAIDTVPCAMFRCFEKSIRGQADMGRTTVFVDVGSRFTTVVFGRGRDITFVKQMKVGSSDFNKAIAAKLDIDVSQAKALRAKLQLENSSQAGLDKLTRQAVVDAVGTIAIDLAREISLCFRYYTVTFRGKRIEQAILSGGQACEKILLDVLQRQLVVDIEIGEPLRDIDISGTSLEDSDDKKFCQWAVAVGLGLKSLKESESVVFSE
ncbi:MAG: pilus assembly protein PilM [Planctomycetota bacterium]|jgi:type IV pilus assembly protein PilM